MTTVYENGRRVWPRPCERCGEVEKAGRKWCLDGAWICQACIPKRPCSTCGVPARGGIERFAIGSADGDAYRLEQSLTFICPKKHLTFTNATETA